MLNNKKKAGYIAILGETNVGKSTFINKVIGEKIAIVSRKVQTTRFKTLGVYTKENSQIIFIDTPGIFKPRSKFGKAMVKHAYLQTQNVDAILLFISSNKGFNHFAKEAIKNITTQSKNIPIYLIVNKVDLLSEKKVLQLMQSISILDELKYITKIFYLSSIKNKGIKILLQELEHILPEHDFYYNDDSITDVLPYKFVTELTREHVYNYIHQEIPYNLIVNHENWKEKDNHIIIHQQIVVNKQRYKNIILGKQGKTIKSISMACAKELEGIFSSKVSLFLHIKVDENLFEKASTYIDNQLEF